jgi:hypothetical protein
MARQLHRLNTLAINKLTTPGRHADGGGLYVVIRQTLGAARAASHPATVYGIHTSCIL